MILFDGKAFARERLHILRASGFFQDRNVGMWSLAFQEDGAGLKYAELKAKDADTVDITYRQHTVSLSNSEDELHAIVRQAAGDRSVHGIIIQKPPQTLMQTALWASLIALIPPEKDVDGLRSDSKLLPATARAIMEVLREASRLCAFKLSEKKVIVIGRSQIVGAPLTAELQRLNVNAVNWGKSELAAQRDELKTADIVVCATGQAGLLRAGDFRPGQNVVIVDAGAPSPEILPDGLEHVAAFATPVPGGVGPVTRVCLLENLRDLVQSVSV